MFGIGSIAEPDVNEEDTADVAQPKDDEAATRAWYAWTYEGGSNWITIWEARYWLLGTLVVGGVVTYIGVQLLHSVLFYLLKGTVTPTMWLFIVAGTVIIFLYFSTGSNSDSSWSSALSNVGSGYVQILLHQVHIPYLAVVADTGISIAGGALRHMVQAHQQ